MSGDKLSIPREMEDRLNKDGFKPRWMNTQSDHFDARVEDLKAKPIEGFEQGQRRELKLMKIPITEVNKYNANVQKENAEALESVLDVGNYSKEHRDATGRDPKKNISFSGVPKPVAGNVTQQRAKGRAMAHISKTIPAFEKK